MEDDLNKMEDEPINLIGCDTIVNSPSQDNHCSLKVQEENRFCIQYI